MGREAQAGPQRSCIACRREGDKASFLRFVLAPDGSVTPDLEEKLPGRGAYTCVARSCLLEAVKKRQFGRSFKGAAAPVDGAALDSLLQEQMERRISGYLALANKAGVATSGGEAVERTIKGSNRPNLLVLSEDISPAIGEKLEGLAQRAGVPVMRALTKETLGMLLGKESDRSAVAIMSPGFGQSLIRELVRYRNYLEEDSGR
ncbi:MAG: DUF448 domain-containing protein [Geobacter sp.]|jgi:uncharacterized protein